MKGPTEMEGPAVMTSKQEEVEGPTEMMDGPAVMISGLEEVEGPTEIISTGSSIISVGPFME